MLSSGLGKVLCSDRVSNKPSSVRYGSREKIIQYIQRLNELQKLYPVKCEDMLTSCLVTLIVLIISTVMMTYSAQRSHLLDLLQPSYTLCQNIVCAT